MKSNFAAWILCLSSFVVMDVVQERLADYVAAKEPEARCAALERIAELESQQDGASPQEVVTALAHGLNDDTTIVRIRCVQLLGSARTAPIALTALAECSRRNAAAIGEAKSEQREILVSGLSPHVNEGKPGDSPIAHGKALAERVLALDAVLVDLSREREALTSVFATQRDDRSVEALAVLVNSMEFDGTSDAATDALLAFGTRRAVEAVVARLSACETVRARVEQSLAKEDKGSEMAKYLTERRRLLDSFAASLQVRLAEFAQARELPRAPGRAFPARNWSKWVERAAPQLAASLASAPKEHE